MPRLSPHSQLPAILDCGVTFSEEKRQTGYAALIKYTCHSEVSELCERIEESP